MTTHTLGGCDTGKEGALAFLDFDPDAGRVLAVRLAAMPTRVRDDGKGLEVVPDLLLLQVRELAPKGWRRMVIERPVRGGMTRQQSGAEFQQGDSHGVARTILTLEAVRTGTACPEAVGLTGSPWHRELGMETAKQAGKDRKTLSIDVAEALLQHLVNTHGATVAALPPCRGYTGLLGGQQQPRSGAADALLLAWLGLRRWLGVLPGAPTLSLDTSWRPEPRPAKPRARKPKTIPEVTP